MNARPLFRASRNCASALLSVSCAFGLLTGMMRAQAPTTNVGTTSATQTATITITTAGTLHSIAVLTQGATGQDFNVVSPNAAATPCTVGTAYAVNDTCTVQYTFTPTHPFLRYGGIALFDSSSHRLGNLFLTGTGTGPQVNFPITTATVPTSLSTGLTSPVGVAVDGSGDVYVGSNSTVISVQEIVAGSGTATTLASGFKVSSIAVDGSGNVYVTDTTNGDVKEAVAVGGVIPATPTILTLASGVSALAGVAVDGSGNVYYTQTSAATVFELVAVHGVIPAGATATPLGSGFSSPAGIAVDGSGNVFVADAGNHAVKEIPAGNGTVTTLSSAFTQPDGIAVDGAGNVYVSDATTKAVKEIVAGSGGTINTLNSGFNSPAGVAVDGSANVYVADTGNNAVDELSDQTAPTVTFASTAVGATSSDSPMTATLGNNGNAPLVFAIPAAGDNPATTAGFSLSPSSTCPMLNSSSGSTASLAPGSTCTEILSFTPTSAGPIMGTSTATDNNLNATGATQAFPLSGTATKGTPGVIVSSPSVPVNTASVTLTAMVSFGGVAPTGAVSFTVNGGGAIAATCTGTTSPLSCTAAFNTSALTVSGSPYAIVATIAADTNYNTASGNGTLTITKATPTVALPNSGTSALNGSVSIVATVTPASGITPTGTVGFTTTLPGGSATAISGCTAVPLVSAAGPSLTATCMTSGLMAGANSIKATLASDSNFNSATSNADVVTVAQATPNVSLPASGSSVVDASVTFTATVTPNSGITPTGTVNFTSSLNGGTAATIPGCGSEPVSGGTASCTTSALMAGSNAVVATLSSDANFASAHSNTDTQTVTKATTSLAIAQPAASTVDQSVSLVATLSSSTAFTVTPGGTVSFTAGGTAIAGCSNLALNASQQATCNTSALVAPSDIIDATYTGDSNFMGATAPQITQSVAKNTPVNTVGSTLTTSVVNQTVTFTATITPNGASAAGIVPTGSVTFTKGSGGPNVCSPVVVTGNAAAGTGSASCTVAFTSAFASTGIFAVYSGDSNFNAGVSPNVAQTVSPANTTTSVTSNPNPSVVNQSVTLTATIAPSNSGPGFTGTATPQSGTLTFSDSLTPGSPFCSTTVSGGVLNPSTCTHIFTTASPNHVITAAFTSTDPNFNSSTTENSVTQVVGASGSTTLTVSNTGSTNLTVNQQTTFAATFSAFSMGQAVPQGTVSYSDSLAASNPICANLAVSSTGTVPNCTETLLVAGTHIITAVFTSSNSNFGTIDSQNFIQVVAQNTTTVALTSPTSSSSSVDQVLTFTATVTPGTLNPAAVGTTNPTGTVTFSYPQNGSTTTICSPTVSTTGSVTSATCMAPLTAAGNYTITATYSGDTNFKTNTSPTHAQTVNKTGTTLALISGSTLSSPAQPAVNQSASYSVQLSLNGSISDSGLTVPTGNVTFTDSTTSATCTAVVASSGQASCSLTEPTAGSHSIVATYAGDSNFSTTMTTFPETIAQSGTTVSGVGSSPSSPAVDQNATLTATVTPQFAGATIPTGTVTFSDAAPGVATTMCVSTLSGGLVPPCSHIFTSAGVHTITATYNGDSNFASNSAMTSVTVGSAGGTSITVATTTPSPTVNQQATFTATFSSLPSGGSLPQGTVSYFDTLVGSSPISTCTNLTVTNGVIPNCVETMLVAGTHNISATFTSSNSNFQTITSPIFPEVVAQNTTTVAFTAPTAGSSSVDQLQTFSATVTPTALTPAAVGTTSPTGTVTFTYSAVVPGSSSPTTGTICTANITTAGNVSSAACPAQAQLTFTGSYTIKATYSGDSNFKAPATAPTISQTVNKTGTSVGLIAGSNLTSPTQPAVNQTAAYSVQISLTGSITDTANGDSVPTGNVTFTDSTTGATCSVAVSASAQASCSFAEPTAGPHTITATYSGDSNFSSSTAMLPETIVLDGTTVPASSIVVTPGSPAVDQSALLNAAVTPVNSGAAIPTGTVTFSDAANGIATTTCVSTLSGGSVPPCSHIFTAAGSHTLTATYSGDANFNGSTASVAVTVVTAGTTTITLGTTTPSPIVNQQATFTASFSSLPPGGSLPQGTVSYFDTLAGSGPISTCTSLTVSNGVIPNCVETMFVAGTHNISATFTSSNSNFQTITSPIFPEVVATNSTSVAITSPTAHTSTVDQLQTFTATVTPAALTPAAVGTTSPTGSVTFSYSAVLTGSSAPTTGIICAANITTTNAGSSATCSSPAPLSFAGAYTITATYSADSNFKTSSSSTTQTVGKTGTSLTIYPAGNPPTPQINVPITFSPQLTTAVSDTGLITPTGQVTLTDGTQAGAPVICNVQVTSNGGVNCPPYAFTTAGPHTIVATYAGDNNFSSTTTSAVVNVTSAVPVVSVTSSSPVNTSIATQTVVFTATVASSPAGSTPPTNATPRDISFQIAQGSTQFTCSSYSQSAPPSPATATCAVTFGNNVAGNVTVVATYNGDSNYGPAMSQPITQTVENFVPTISPAQLTLTQGNTNLTDAYNHMPIQLTSVSESGFTDPVALTACSVTSVATGLTAVGVTCAPNASSTTSGAATITATATAAIGTYTVTYTISDVGPTPGLMLSQTTTSTVTVINQPGQLLTLTAGTVAATFSLPPTLVTSASSLSCNNSVATGNANGTYTLTTQTLSGIGIACSAITGSNPYSFVITAGSGNSASLQRANNGILAAVLGAPFLLMFGLLPSFRKHRKTFLRVLGMLVLAVATLHTTGCGGGGFVRGPTPVTAVSGSYLISIVNAQGATVAEIPLVIAGNSQ